MLPTLRRIEVGIQDDAFRAVLETIPDAVALVEDSGRIAAVNSTAETMFGRREEELLGQLVEILIPQRYREPHPRQVQEYFAQPQVAYGPDRFRHGQEMQIFAVRADGEEFPVEISIGPVETPEGLFALTVIRDITQKKRLQAKLTDYNRSLEREVRERTLELQMRQAELIQTAKMAALGNLAAGVVHEMNTPLGALRSANQSALSVARRLLALESGKPISSGRSPAEMAKLLEDLAAASEKAISELSRTVTSLRIFARIDSFDDSEEDLVEGLRSVLALLEPRTRGRIRVEEHFERLPLIRGKHADLNQALMNVISNAIEAIEADGALRVSSQRVDGEALIEIADTGRGITEEDLPHIFDPGFTTKGVKVGSGLGLAIAHRILSEHGGRIEARSRLGEGTTVRIALPLATSALAD
jgi:PAS domain S-box-containing protein